MMFTDKVDRVAGTMVFCVSCQSVVWAHDHDHGDVRGLCNLFRLSCPVCEEVASFDEYRIRESHLAGLDPWAYMHQLAKREGLAWRNSPDLSWAAPR